MSKNYNKREYVELLKKQLINGKLNSDDYTKRLAYSIRAKDYLNWCIKEHYIDLLDNFQKGKIEAFEFCINFQNANNILVQDVLAVLESKLIVLSPNKKSLAFADLLEEMFNICADYLYAADAAYLAVSRDCAVEKYETDLKLEESEIYLKKSAKATYLKIQNFLKEE